MPEHPVGTRVANFDTTVPFRLTGELQYTSWDELQRTLGGQVKLGDLPQLRLEFTQEVSQLQGAVGVQLFETHLPRIGPLLVQAGTSATVRWAEHQEFELAGELEIQHVRWPALSFTVEGSMSLAAGSDQPEVGGAIQAGLKVNFDFLAPSGTFRRRD